MSKNMTQKNNKTYSQIQCNILIISERLSEIETYITNLINFVNCPLNPIITGKQIKVFKIKQKYLGLLEYKKESLITFYQNIEKHFSNEKFMIFFFVTNNFNLQNHFKILDELQTKIKIISISYFSFEDMNILNQNEMLKNDFAVDIIPKNNSKIFLELISSKIKNAKIKRNFKSKDYSLKSYLQKKHKKIFLIEKIPKENKIDFAKENVINISQISEEENEIKEIKDEKEIKENMDEDNSNSIEEPVISNKITVEIPSDYLKSENEEPENLLSRNSLISISKEVYKFIMDKKSTKGSDVTDHILKILQEKGNKLNYKNIQRRVYDAINVMTAIGIIRKDKGSINIEYEKLENTLEKKENNKTEDSKDHLLQFKQLEEIEKENEKLKINKQKLINDCAKIIFFAKLIQLNKNDFIRSITQDKLNFPLYVVSLKKENQFYIKEVDNNNKVIMLSQNYLNLIEPDSIIKYWIKDDFNENNLNQFLSKDEVQYIKDNNLLNKYYNNFTGDNFPFENLLSASTNLETVKNIPQVWDNEQAYPPMEIKNNEYDALNNMAFKNIHQFHSFENDIKKFRKGSFDFNLNQNDFQNKNINSNYLCDNDSDADFQSVNYTPKVSPLISKFNK